MPRASPSVAATQFGTVRSMSTGASPAPSQVLVKVGNSSNSSEYLSLDLDWASLKDMNTRKLLRTLKADDILGGHFADVQKLADCQIMVIKGSIPEDRKGPEAAEEALDNVVKLGGSWTLADAAREGVCTGSRLFVHVLLPPQVPPPQEAQEAAKDLATAIAAGETLLRAMLEAKPEDIKGAKSGARLIRLPGNAEWLQLGGEPLFVRHFYQQCAEKAMGNLEPGRRFIIRGNGGIGKSSYGLFLMWRAVNAGRTVVYVSDKVMCGYIFYADGRVVAFPNTELRRKALSVMDDPNTLVIFDGDGDCNIKGQGRPPICKATTVLITSPKLMRYSAFEQTGVTHLVFPVFSRDEISDMLESCYPALHTPEARAGVEDRYQRWGGIPRYVLKLLGSSDQAKLDNALTAIDFDRLADVIRQTDVEDDSAVSHRLFHLKPAGETAEGFVGGDTEGAYALARTELGSQIIAEKVYAAMKQSRSDKLLALLAQPTKGTQLAKFYGDIFQQHALAKLREGSTAGFTTYALNPSLPDVQRTDTLKLPASDIIYFNDCAELEAAAVGRAYADRIWVPRAANFATVDLILPGQRLANFTINATHQILLFAKGKKQGLIPVAESLRLLPAGRVSFYWVMPRERFEMVRAKGGAPFPIALRGPSKSANSDEDEGSADGLMDAGAILEHIVPTTSVPAPRGRGRPTKDPMGAQTDAKSVLDKYAGRIEQYLLLVPFDVLKLAAPTPST